ncbi:unnamed protein product [Rotaria sp. Silwood1]|nr:unnamed protein product [Rotaria sp. Silwood1]CAF1577767.1 unnamed protein product [Rotaria sp. Silwood1]CAF3702788.1 unnamed protein product [Rotaria sp. Silwood1]CAF3734776.1 unnamed protein product [Rotaria sp. Silwood1]CAF4835281.1 unnamed protein product [Rotaria sp. Silwood1]
MASMNIENKNEEHIATSIEEKISIPESISTHEHSETCNDPTHQHNHPSSMNLNDLISSLSPVKTERSVKKKSKKNGKHTSIRAESIPGHRGNENIDDLVNFINGLSPINNKKKTDNNKN